MAYTASTFSAFEQPTTAKWNYLWANDAVFNDVITGVTNLTLRDNAPTGDGVIGFDRTNEDLVVGDGTVARLIHTGNWKAFTPSWTNITVGNGTSTGKYTIIGKTVLYTAVIQFGSTTSISGSVTLAVPITQENPPSGAGLVLGQVMINDSGTTLYFGNHLASGTVTVGTTNGTYLGYTTLSSTVPMTWTTGDQLAVTGWYEIDV